MIAAGKPTNETERISALYEYNILDTLPEKEYDDITKIAADICGMPISLITIIDNERQWFKSNHGLDGTETARDEAFCAHAILEPHEIFMVPDSSKDERFFDNPYVTGPPHVGFYAGVPLVMDNGTAMGTLCVLDKKPNDITPAQKETLKALARQVVAGFEVRKLNHKLSEQKAQMELLNEDLTNFAHAVAHDIKSPCASIAMCTAYLLENEAGTMSPEGKTFLDMMHSTSHSAVEMVNGVLRHTLEVNNADITKEHFTFGGLAAEVKKLITLPGDFIFEVKHAELQLFAPKSVLLQVLINLANNAIKYNDKPEGSVILDAAESLTHYTFSVTDNGRGISPENQSRIFGMFNTLGIKDRFNNKGTGIGLSTVKRLVQKANGNISVTSQPGAGSKFTFTIRK